MDQRTQPVVLETQRYRVEGLISLPQEGYRSRITDYLNSAELDFIALKDAIVLPLEGMGERREYPFLALARAHVVFVAPADGAE